jgi:hypothetical protein
MRRTVVFLALAISLVLTTPTISGANSGYGTPVGKVSGCAAKALDKSDLPLIVILLKRGTPYAWYNVSADPGTTWYHFDVPVGHYQLMSTYTGTKSYSLNVKFGASPRTDLTISCATDDY